MAHNVATTCSVAVLLESCPVGSSQDHTIVNNKICPILQLDFNFGLGSQNSKLRDGERLNNACQTTPPGTLCPTLFVQCVGSFMSHRIVNIMKSCETGPTVYLPYLRRLESLAICRCNLQRQPCLINNWSNYYLITIITKILSFFGFNLLVAMKHRIPASALLLRGSESCNSEM